MNTCPQCKFESAAATGEACPQCGYLLGTQTIPETNTSDDDLGFVVTEADDDPPELSRGARKLADEDDLRLQSTADLMENEAQSNSGDKVNKEISLTEPNLPIGQSEPPLPPPPEDLPPVSSQPPITEAAELTTDGVKKLSADEIKSVEQNLYAGQDGLSDKEKQDLLNKIGNVGSDQPFSNTPISPPKRDDKLRPSQPTTKTGQKKPDLPKPVISQRGKGVAWFKGRYIQLAGSHEINPGDELVVDGRSYQLKPKQVGPRTMIAVLALPVLLLCFWVGSMIVGGNSETGSIVGVVLDHSGTPVGRNVSLAIPTLGKNISPDSDGLFLIEDVPQGTHEIEYVLSGKVVNTGFATVSGNRTTRLSLSPAIEKVTVVTKKKTSSPKKQPARASIGNESPKPKQVAQTTKPKPKSKKPKAATTKKATTGWSKLTLAANIESAKLELDGSTLGAGNLTFSRIKSGQHTYTISADGYASESGTVYLPDGKTTKLEVTLSPLTQAEIESGFSAKDHYLAAIASKKAGDIETTLEGLAKALELDPSYADAHFQRAEIYMTRKERDLAHEDFLRAAEIYRFQDKYNSAITAYNRAIKAERKSLPAYLGLADLYLARGEQIAAVTNYEAALRIDKRNAHGHYGLGETRFKQGRYKKALKHFKDARSLDGKNPLVYQYLMLSYMAVNDVKNVRKSFDKFMNVATEKQARKLASDPTYSDVMKTIDTD